MEVIKKYVPMLRAEDLHNAEYICTWKEGNLVNIVADGSKDFRGVVNFSSNDILGFAGEGQIEEAAINAIRQFGTSNSSSEALCGRISLHPQLEAEISRTKELPHTKLFLNAWMAIQAFIDAFCHLGVPVPHFKHTRPTLIFSDVLNHSSINAAVFRSSTLSSIHLRRGPEVNFYLYRHCDAGDLERRMARHAHLHTRIVVISDSVFSMDGDIAPLPDIVDVMQKYDDSVLVFDEAHATGAIGKTGRGVFEHFNLTPQHLIERGLHPIIMSTFSKFAASSGAAISSHVAELIEVLINSPTSFGTASLTPANTAAALESFRLLRKMPERIQKLHENTSYLRRQLTEHNFEILGETHIVPVLLPQNVSPKGFANRLLENHKIWVSGVWYVAKPRLRIVVNALHTREQLDELVSGMVATYRS